MANKKLPDRTPSNDAKSTDRNLYVVCGLLAVIILVIDLTIPLGVAFGVPYIAIILLSLKSTKEHTAMILAVICSVFVVIGFMVSPEGGQMWQVIANRLLALFAIWATLLLSLSRLRKERLLHIEQLKNLQITKDIEIQKERLNVLKATMRTVQGIVGNFLNNLLFIRLEIKTKQTLSPEALDKLDRIIKDTASQINKLGNLDSIHEKKMADNKKGIDYEFSESAANKGSTPDAVEKTIP